MTKEHIHKELINLWANGASIETYGVNDGWTIVKYPVWYPDMFYRVCNEPNVIRHTQVSLHVSSGIFGLDARMGQGDNVKFIFNPTTGDLIDCEFIGDEE
jgi:hypothetical protein